MKYWGNDIVALNDPLLRHGASRANKWLAKACTATELVALARCADQHIARWRLWACKESVYKVLMKQGISAFLNPKRIEIQMIDTWESPEFHFTAYFEGQSYSGYSQLTADWVHCLCCTHSFQPDDYQAEVMVTQKETASRQVRERVIQQLERTYGLAVTSIEQTAQKVPVALGQDGKLAVELSFSHHAPYSAYLLAVSTAPQS